jgi:hypothetical protein
MNFKLPNISMEALCCVRTEDDVFCFGFLNYLVASWEEHLNSA